MRECHKSMKNLNTPFFFGAMCTGIYGLVLGALSIKSNTQRVDNLLEDFVQPLTNSIVFSFFAFYTGGELIGRATKLVCFRLHPETTLSFSKPKQSRAAAPKDIPTVDSDSYRPLDDAEEIERDLLTRVNLIRHSLFPLGIGFITSALFGLAAFGCWGYAKAEDDSPTWLFEKLTESFASQIVISTLAVYAMSNILATIPVYCVNSSKRLREAEFPQTPRLSP